MWRFLKILDRFGGFFVNHKICSSLLVINLTIFFGYHEFRKIMGSKNCTRFYEQISVYVHCRSVTNFASSLSHFSHVRTHFAHSVCSSITIITTYTNHHQHIQHQTHHITSTELVQIISVQPLSHQYTQFMIENKIQLFLDIKQCQNMLFRNVYLL